MLSTKLHGDFYDSLTLSYIERKSKLESVSPTELPTGDTITFQINVELDQGSEIADFCGKCFCDSLLSERSILIRPTIVQV